MKAISQVANDVDGAKPGVQTDAVLMEESIRHANNVAAITEDRNVIKDNSTFHTVHK